MLSGSWKYYSRDPESPEEHAPGRPLAVRRAFRGTQREYSSKPLKHSIIERILVFKR